MGKTGQIDCEEFRALIRKHAKITAETVPDKQLQKVFGFVDKDATGTISCQEFIQWLGVENAKDPEADGEKEFKRQLRKAKTAGLVHDTSAYGLDASSVEEIKKKLKSAAYWQGGVSWERLFAYVDRDKTGQIDCEEFRALIRKHAKITAETVPDKQLQKVFGFVDKDATGTISCQEFIQWLGIENKKADEQNGFGARREQLRTAKTAPAQALDIESF